MQDYSKLTYWFEEIDNITNDFTGKFGALSFEELNWKPNLPIMLEAAFEIIIAHKKRYLTRLMSHCNF